jgi:hypothetical protein
MTLCIVWRQNSKIHFASDSRLTFGESVADVGIKVLSVPYTIYAPIDNAYTAPNILACGSLGLCIAGSSLNAMLIKESIVEIVKALQAVPSMTDYSMDGLSEFVFYAYKIISEKLCKTDLYKDGRTTMIIGGWCTTKNNHCIFKFETDDSNQHSKNEILMNDGDYVLIGSGAEAAKKFLSTKNPITDKNYFEALKCVVDDDKVPSVGGAIQYGFLEQENFRVFGIINYDESEENKNGISYMRGGLDLRLDGFDKLLPMMRYIDLEID